MQKKKKIIKEIITIININNNSYKLLSNVLYSK